jgi:hypothetical protein
LSGATEATYSRRAIVAIVGVAVVSFVLAFVLAAFGESLGTPVTPQANTFSYSAIGHRALVEVLEAAGTTVRIRRDQEARDLGPDHPLLVLEPPPPRNDPVLTRIYYATSASTGAPFVVALPKWTGASSELERRWLETVTPVRLGDAHLPVAQLLRELGLEAVQLLRPSSEDRFSCSAGWKTFQVRLSTPQFLGLTEDFEPVVECDGNVLVARTDQVPSEGPLYLVADPDLLNNHGLHEAEHAALIDWLIHDHLGATRVTIDEVVHGYGRDRGVLAELLRFPLVLAVLHGLLILGLAIWIGARRIGKPVPTRPPMAGGKITLVDNAAMLLGRGGHSVITARRYYEQTLRAVAAHYFLPADTPIREVAERLQHLAGRRKLKVDLADLGSRLHRLSPDRRRSPEHAVKIALELYRFRQEMTDATRRDS